MFAIYTHLNIYGQNRKLNENQQDWVKAKTVGLVNS